MFFKCFFFKKKNKKKKRFAFILRGLMFLDSVFDVI